MMFTPKPHVSKALSQLRYSVAATAFTVAACATIQLFVFGFTHFTTVRWEFAKPANLVQELSVVSAGETPPAVADAAPRPPDAVLENGRKVRKLSDLEALETLRTPSRWDAVLDQFSVLAGVGGVISALTLGALLFMGVVIAGGGCVPGVEKTVNAALWAIVLGLVCVPWRDVMPSVPFAGVFGRGSELTAASEDVNAGHGRASSLYAGYLLLPLTAIAVALMVWHQFREGVDRGIIVTSISDLELTVDRELEKVRSRGVVSHVGPRATGALNMAIGERPVAPSAPPLAVASGGDAFRSKAPLPDRRLGEPDPGDPLKRPI
jgi:hypothetical protein